MSRGAGHSIFYHPATRGDATYTPSSRGVLRMLHLHRQHKATMLTDVANVARSGRVDGGYGFDENTLRRTQAAGGYAMGSRTGRALLLALGLQARNTICEVLNAHADPRARARLDDFGRELLAKTGALFPPRMRRPSLAVRGLFSDRLSGDFGGIPAAPAILPRAQAPDRHQFETK